jgi:putative aldouronate transport system permease protein
LAGIIAINPEYTEAARLDGASRWKQARYLTIPLIAPLIVINALLMVSRIFYGDFGLFFQVPMNNPQLYPATDVIDTYVYRALTETGNVGQAAAAGLYQAVFGFILVLTVNGIIRKTAPEKALF